MSYQIQEYATDVERTRFAPRQMAVYLLMGILFGIILTKSEVVSWFRIQEMFRFQSFHMYGVIGSAIAVAAVSLWVVDRMEVSPRQEGKSMLGRGVKAVGIRHIAGGSVFGFGWALTGACPGPIYSLIGAGAPIMIVVLISAVGGAWVYGHLRSSLPH